MLINDNLVKVLSIHQIQTQDYKPAYNGTSVGLDLYNVGPTLYIPPSTNNFKEDLVFSEPASEEVVQKQFKKIFKTLIPSGLHLSVPNGWAAIIQERGSITKTPLRLRAGVIDPDYTGEVFVNCVNLSAHPWEIPHGSKLPFQIVVVRANTHFSHVTLDEYQELTQGSTRKQGMVGSSDNNK
jgi:dUTPase